MSSKMKVLVVSEVPDPVAYKAGFKRRLQLGVQEVPCDKDHIRLLRQGYMEPMCELSAKRCGRPVKKPAQAPSKSNS